VYGRFLIFGHRSGIDALRIRVVGESSNSLKGTDMNTIRTARLASFLIFAALGGAAHAQSSGLTRAEVKQQTLEAIRTGDIAAVGETGKTERELFPNRYPKPPVAAGETRLQVKAELKEAIREGDVPAGDLQETPRELEPGRFPVEPKVAQVTRAQVKADLRDAIRTGDIPSVGDLAEPLNQLEPQRYPIAASVSRH
jgi:hypothetical protein